jgi:hypothetical protein
MVSFEKYLSSPIVQQRPRSVTKSTTIYVRSSASTFCKTQVAADSFSMIFGL